MKLPNHKTKIVCTLGPASGSASVMEGMVTAGMTIARFNFSHGDLGTHKRRIEALREVARSCGQKVAMLGDLPGPKIRIGLLGQEPVELKPGESIALTTAEIVGDSHRVSVNFPRLPQTVRAGDMLFLNDGFIQLEVVRVRGKEVECKVLVGGELRSRKGLNLPGIDLGMSAFTDLDHRWLRFAKEEEMDGVSLSFVESAADIGALRRAADDLGYHPFIIAKIERLRALDHIDEILEVADGMMIARGDLGVEIPIEKIAAVQKQLVRKANRLGKPVITATQMLESMTRNLRPTRAEATDVANAILDGTDCIMLSEESATGRFPVEAVAMVAKIAAAIEPHQAVSNLREGLGEVRGDERMGLRDLIAHSVRAALERLSPTAVFVPTLSGATARSIARFRLPVWIVAVTPDLATCQRLQFSYGVYPVHEPEYPEDWRSYIATWLLAHGEKGDLVVLTEGPSTKHPEANHRMEIIDLTRR